jgi:hypothetical protein
MLAGRTFSCGRPHRYGRRTRRFGGAGLPADDHHGNGPAALRDTVTTNKLGQEFSEGMQRRYFLKPTEIGLRVYYRLTSHWLELTARFIVRDRGIREAKDALSRAILQGLERAGVELASATFEIVGVPPLRTRKSRLFSPPACSMIRNLR